MHNICECAPTCQESVAFLRATGRIGCQLNEQPGGVLSAKASGCPFLGPKPAVSVSLSDGMLKIKAWLKDRQSETLPALEVTEALHRKLKHLFALSRIAHSV
jgi:hypothetical protein